MEDYKAIRGYGVQVEELKSKTQEKGQIEELDELVKCLNGEKEDWPISHAALIETTEVTFAISE